MIVINLLWP